MTEYLQHNRIKLALHTLRPGDGTPLLLLHGLGERSPDAVPGEFAGWPGPIHALDFTGHGASQIPVGGGYTCELLMADADTALLRLKSATVVGRGVGGYIAMLLAGARPEAMRGAIVLDGPGLAGGGTHAKNPYIPVVDTAQMAPPDPFALADLATDARPPSYAANFAMLADMRSDLVHPISVCAFEQPEWLAGVMSALNLEKVTLQEALQRYIAQETATAS